ncbi:MAG: M28 family peptidase [Parvularculaceae bacterium]
MSSKGRKSNFGGFRFRTKTNAGYVDRKARLSGSQFNETLEVSDEIASALGSLKHSRIEQTTRWLSTEFQTRASDAANPNAHVHALAEVLDGLKTAAGRDDIEISTVSHAKTRQRTVKARFAGKSRPAEIVVLGAHLDSLNMVESLEAPGADDNASGSAVLLEIYTLLLQQPQRERTVDFFWYAAEERGLIGSREIARDYAGSRADVIGVAQFDMTMLPGSGANTIAIATADDTSAWLTDYFVYLNEQYVKAKMEFSECPYPCSDHVSWTQQGYPAAYPMEARWEDTNRAIHTADDRLDPHLSAPHAALFAKLGVAFALDLSNSTIREPFR